MKNIIKLSHGSGGEMTHKLIKELFIDRFNNSLLNKMNDSSVVDIAGKKIAFTTDSYVINPIFFPGGDIGKLAVCGTVNDLAMSGAKPIALSCGFLIEEGFGMDSLEKIVDSMVNTCKEVGVEFITGDTKVVNRGGLDKIFINTSGIGIVDDGVYIGGEMAEVGDKIIISGSIGEHGTSIMLARENFEIEADIISDVAPLNGLVEDILSVSKNIHVLRDPTRGGLATTLNEIAEQSSVSIQINESAIPIKDNVKGVCNILGLDPLYLANEGKLVCFVSERDSKVVLEKMKNNKYGADAAIIGEVIKKDNNGTLYMATKSGGSRIINKLSSDFLPRIC